jgi:hypothetical protein
MSGRVGRNGVDPGKRSLLLVVLFIVTAFSIHPHISIRPQ